MDTAALDLLLDEPLEASDKPFPPTRAPVAVRTVGEQGWNVLRGDLLLPALVLKERALAHNLARMARFCSEHGASLAPHGKTTMAPQIVARQLAAGAWGITAATTTQARTFRRFGVGRILLANELVEPAALRWVADELATDSQFDFLCLVDSEHGVALMDEALSAAGSERRLAVLLELGVREGRAGCRTDEEAQAVAHAVAASSVLELAGVEGYEGVIGAVREPDVEARVDRLLDRVARLAVTLDGDGAFDGRDEIVISAGGSAFPDHVVGAFAAVGPLSRPLRVVLRSGCYVTHDHGRYEEISPLSRRAGADDPLRPALELWATVLSRPEPDLAIVGFGKRDAPFDLGPPLPTQLVRRDGDRVGLTGELVVRELNDQQAYVRVVGLPVEVGDLLGCGISHPCTAFDKWRLIPVVDEDYTVTGAVRTLF